VRPVLLLHMGIGALLGSPENGHWSIGRRAAQTKVSRRYREGTLVLETEFSSPEGTAVLIDCTDRRGEHQDVVRLVRGVHGRVPMEMELAIRFEYGTVVPSVRRLDDGRLSAVAGPDRMVLATPPELRGEDLKTRAKFDVEEGQTVSFTLSWSHSFSPMPASPDAATVIDQVTAAWEKWSSPYTRKGPYREAVLRSLVTLKALTHHETGGIVAAATTSLPEQIGGTRNWDYRFCWLRDAAYTLYALVDSGFMEEAKAWRDWLLRAVAGSPDQMQIMYGLAGERRLTEFELPELPGYEGSQPVRVGNAASEQLQLDIYGEVLGSGYLARRQGQRGIEEGWRLARAAVSNLERIWTEPDEGIWEIRGPRRHFVHSKVMAWVAVDRAVRIVQQFGEDGPLDHWIRLRSDIHEEVCRLGFSRELNSFVQSYGSKELDASLLLPAVGFLPPDDPRVQGTIAAIERNLMQDGFVALQHPQCR
jgi:GH15 family glucan-1,4-alpha-glucosidase